MDITFSLRRKEIIEDEPLVAEINSRWPVLFTERQVCAEFSRLVSMDLKKTFLAALDQHSPRLLAFYRMKGGGPGKNLQSVLESLDKNNSNRNKRSAVLRGLPYFIGEDPSNLFITCLATDPEENTVKGLKIGTLTVREEVFSEEIINVALVLEEQVVVTDLWDVSNAIAVLFGLLYALNIEYPRVLRYTFEVIQKVFMNIGGVRCSARVQSLKNRLFL
ncbi:sterile alpha motif domain-containing protein 3-like [Acipenser oxyrinchus oxyrinchus]|uniref:Sterile alpha motif domain-containing protein 3-like n=1 Tax=Acipenser oxyrinchus oxyrinchus TaxID=40147 RepID=A0AAD8D1X9_ACIOX|nr:sterile alpha motif domain-containing protein 3-like [Acipenser oxyrinchus oxyrinchus]